MPSEYPEYHRKCFSEIILFSSARESVRFRCLDSVTVTNLTTKSSKNVCDSSSEGLQRISIEIRYESGAQGFQHECDAGFNVRAKSMRARDIQSLTLPCYVRILQLRNDGLIGLWQDNFDQLPGEHLELGPRRDKNFR